jgi:predicted amino acid dehydrogenase
MVLQSVAKKMRELGRHLAVAVVVIVCYSGVIVIDMPLASRRYSIVSKMKSTLCYSKLTVK